MALLKRIECNCLVDQAAAARKAPQGAFSFLKKQIRQNDFVSDGVRFNIFG